MLPKLVSDLVEFYMWLIRHKEVMKEYHTKIEVAIIRTDDIFRWYPERILIERPDVPVLYRYVVWKTGADTFNKITKIASRDNPATKSYYIGRFVETPYYRNENYIIRK